jgi:hypothetical protein
LTAGIDWPLQSRDVAREPKMRVLGLAVAGSLALTAPLAGHAASPGSNIEQLDLTPGIVEVWGGCGWGWHPVPGRLEPVERRMGFAVLRTEPSLRRVGCLWVG